MMKIVSCLIGLIILFTFLIFPQALPITIDGEFNDWKNAHLLFERTEIDETILQLVRLWAANDNRFLFLRVEFNQEFTLLENNSIILYLDTDNKKATGFSPDTIGAELRWEFGDRRGWYYGGSQPNQIFHRHIRLRTGPTVSSNEFEIAIGRDEKPDNVNNLFVSDTLRIFIRDESVSFPPIPDEEEFITYVFDPTPVEPPSPITLERYTGTDLRILGFNVWNDKIFDVSLHDRYARVLNAIQPDIIAFQEVWNHSAEQTATRVSQLIPFDNDSQWYAVKEDPGNVTVSRFPIIGSWQIPVDFPGQADPWWSRMTASLIDMEEEYGTQLFLINVHLRAGSGGEDRRWSEIQALITFIEEAKIPGGMIPISWDTPIVLVGDFNLVGSSEQLGNLLNAQLDWDEKPLVSVMPRQTQKRMIYTWRNDWSSFSPGKLDYIFYSSAVLSLQNKYVLQVEEMSPDQRQKYNLIDGDTQFTSDHLPIVADFIVKDVTRVGEHENLQWEFSATNYPNPFNPFTTIYFTLPEPGKVKVSVYTLLGQEVVELANEYFESGQNSIVWDGRDSTGNTVSSGVYFYRIDVDSIGHSIERRIIETGSMVLVR